MKLVKRLAAMSLAVIMAIVAAGCHKKDEIAVKIGDWEFTSAYYMCTMIYADTEARQTIDNQLAEKNKDDTSSSTSSEDVDYLSQKIDDMSFTDWVKKETLKDLRRIAAYKTKCKENDLKLEDSVVSGVEQYAEYYWSQYGYQNMMEPNGVSKETFTEYLKNSYYSSLYFDHLYGEGGEREISADDVKAKIVENYVVANVISANYESDATDEQKSELKAKLDGYANAISAGKMTFDEVYKDYYGQDSEDASSTTDTDAEEGSQPQDSKAQVLGSSETSQASDYFDTVKAMANGAAQTVSSSDGSGLVLLVKKDITADPYYFKNLDTAARQLISGKDLESEMDTFGETLNLKEYKSNTNLFKVKKIVYPQTSTSAS